MPIADGLVAFTVTPGSTALLVSVTRPLIEPVVLAPPPCAKAAAGARVGTAVPAPATRPRTDPDMLHPHPRDKAAADATTPKHTNPPTTNPNPRFIRAPPQIYDATNPIQTPRIANAQENASFH